jgi:hypothetical protein
MKIWWKEQLDMAFIQIIRPKFYGHGTTGKITDSQSFTQNRKSEKQLV